MFTTNTLTCGKEREKKGRWGREERTISDSKKGEDFLFNGKSRYLRQLLVDVDNQKTGS